MDLDFWVGVCKLFCFCYFYLLGFQLLPDEERLRKVIESCGIYS